MKWLIALFLLGSCSHYTSPYNNPMLLCDSGVLSQYITSSGYYDGTYLAIIPLKDQEGKTYKCK